MLERLACLAIGYILGCVLTADIVCRRTEGASAFETGDGNPGMANIAATLGVKRGLVVLAGDLAKTIVAVALARVLFPDLGMLAALWAAVGATFGHNFSALHRFRGGKGVATTCAGIVMTSPIAGIIACLAGLAGCAISGYLCIGAVVIPTTYLAFCVAAALGAAPAAFALGIDAATFPASMWEPVALAVVLLAFMIAAHGGPILGIRRGTTPQASLFRRNGRRPS